MVTRGPPSGEVGRGLPVTCGDLQAAVQKDGVTGHGTSYAEQRSGTALIDGSAGHRAGLCHRRTVTTMQNRTADDYEGQAPACILGKHENCPHLNGYGGGFSLRRLRWVASALLCKCDCHSSCPLTGKRTSVLEQTWHESCTCPGAEVERPRRDPAGVPR